MAFLHTTFLRSATVVAKTSCRRSVVAPGAATTSRNFSSSVSENDVRGLFHLWNDALATLDSDTVAQRYTKDAVLLPTVSDHPRNDYEGIKDYFDHFLVKQPQGKILQSFVKVGNCGKWAQDHGIYEFTLNQNDAKVKARYSFVYVRDDDDDDCWKISHHHSSQMPEEIEPKRSANEQQILTKEETRNLFELWNDALATGDPKIVADRYSKNAILLPTVSDVPRNTPSQIEDYFFHFLQSKPQGVITDGVIVAGEPNWAKDAGVYEFTMGATGDKVKARYSYVYVWEDGEWKIAHHHSSAMPEELMSAATKLKEIENILSK